MPDETPTAPGPDDRPAAAPAAAATDETLVDAASSTEAADKVLTDEVSADDVSTEEVSTEEVSAVEAVDDVSGGVADDEGSDHPPQAESAPGEASWTRESTGVVISNKPDKTITVLVERRVKHPVYGKFIRRSNKVAAHDEANTCREGDVVAIVETRPISKTKSWTLARVVERYREPATLGTDETAT